MVDYRSLVFDDWQKEILSCDDDILLCKGRRIGGTEIFSIKAVEEMAKIPGIELMFVSLTEDQAQIIIDVAHSYALVKYPKLIGKGKRKPTLNKLFFTNGSKLIVRPLGSTGNSVRSFNGDVIGIDEAPWQNKQIWRALRPIIATSKKGRIWMWGTPAAKEGYFWEQYDKIVNKKLPGRFKVWHKNSEEVLFNRPISASWTVEQAEGVRRILAEEKASMSELEYANEFLGEFLEELQRLFSDSWIEKVCVLKRTNHFRKPYLGVDVSGLGRDKNSFEVVDKVSRTDIRHIENLTSRGKYTFEVVDTILNLHDKFKFRKLGVDDAGVGFGVFSGLLAHPKTRRDTISLNNSRRVLDSDGKTKKSLLKEDMYINLLSLGEQGFVKLLDDEDVKHSLASMQINHENAKIFIFGRDNHISEGIVRAVYLACQDNSLDLWAR